VAGKADTAAHPPRADPQQLLVQMENSRDEHVPRDSQYMSS
jgi:hypothetical protein